jgi:hypothetical protein
MGFSAGVDQVIALHALIGRSLERFAALDAASDRLGGLRRIARVDR